MAEEKKLLTMDELLAANVDSLTTEQLSRRSQIIVLMKQERELEVVNEQNRKFSEEREQRQKQIRETLRNIQQQHEENQRIHKMCHHKTGGKDRAGFFQGDGDVYGYCVSRQMLPTGEIYGLCFRCQKEWHSPIWWIDLPDGSHIFDGRKAVVEGKAALAVYCKQDKEFKEMLAWPAKTFEGQAGELPGGAMFLIPSIQKQFQKSAADFTAFLAKVPANELILAGYQPSA